MFCGGFFFFCLNEYRRGGPRVTPCHKFHNEAGDGEMPIPINDENIITIGITGVGLYIIVID